jgi:hypothetical protein
LNTPQDFVVAWLKPIGVKLRKYFFVNASHDLYGFVAAGFSRRWFGTFQFTPAKAGGYKNPIKNPALRGVYL